MNDATSYKDRKFIEQRVADGATSKTIAAELGISVKTVNKWRLRIKKNA